MEAHKVPIENLYIKDYDPNVWRKLPGIISGNAPYIPLVKVSYVYDGVPCELLETHNYPVYQLRPLWPTGWMFPDQVLISDERLIRIAQV